jgi:hypothetical protein
MNSANALAAADTSGPMTHGKLDGPVDDDGFTALARVTRSPFCWGRRMGPDSNSVKGIRPLRFG